MTIDVVVLAAGQGTRMRSRLPKVLHPVAGKPMVQHVLEAAGRLSDSRLHVVIGHGGEQVRARLADLPVNWIVQEQQLGTGHAVAQALDHLQSDSKVLVLYGDVPLISTDTLDELLDQVHAEQLALLTVDLDDPTGYGRIVRNDAGQVTAIVEHKDANEQQRAIREINTGILALHAAQLRQWLPQLSNSNAQGEYYLTDIIAMAAQAGMAIAAIQPASPEEVQGVNNRLQLAELERWYQRQQAERLMLAGATVLDPARLDVRGTVEIGQDIVLDVNVILEGEVTLGNNVRIGPNCLIRNAVIADNVVIEANSVVDGAVVAEECVVGPFARLRPGTRLARQAKVGNFVETKQALVGEGSKINHLSYVGDAELGQAVNVGAGTITCNYDGANKHRTVIGDRAFIGSNSALVAPVTIGAGATVGAGSTISKDVSEDTLAVARAKQLNKSGWKRPQKG